MMRHMSIVKRQSTSAGWWFLLLQGLVLLALAGLVLYEPATLVYLVAATLVVAGIACMVVAWRIRRASSTVYRYWTEWWWADAL